MKFIAIAAAVLALAGCEAMRTVAPQTVAGFDAGGIIGALDGASGAILARCQTLDGQILRVAIDDLAFDTGTDDLVEDVRIRRQRACAMAGVVQAIADEDAAPESDVTAHGERQGQGGAALPEG